jgi:mono/diheme cytochrome c family protein
MRVLQRSSALVLLALATACEPDRTASLYLPDGDPEPGRVAFAEMQCFVCHEVGGDTFPPPHASEPVPIRLGPHLAVQPRGQLFESIIAPSHRIPGPMEGVQRGELSRMGDYSEAMTVRQLIDIVAYLQALEN